MEFIESKTKPPGNLFLFKILDFCFSAVRPSGLFDFDFDNQHARAGGRAVLP